MEHNKTLNNVCLMDETWYNHHVDREKNLFIFDNINYPSYI